MNKVYVLEGCKLHEQRVLLSVFSTYEKAEIALKFFEQKLNFETIHIYEEKIDESNEELLLKMHGEGHFDGYFNYWE